MKAEDKIYKDKSRYLCGLQNSLGNLNFTMMRKFWFVAIFTVFSGIKAVQSECSHSNTHCHHLCQSSGKYNCLGTSGNGQAENHGCECLPKDYCDHRYSCTSTDVACLHNEAIRCNGNNKCECYCSQDSQCHNCPAGTLGFCVNEKCVCETNNYCPGNNKFYCLKNFQCAYSESKRCKNDRCECFCNMDTDCKNCPEKGFCVDGSCVCESQDYCPKGNHLYCLSLTCDRGYTSKCNSTNRCYCAYVPDTCSNHDVSKCYHLTCSPGEKKYCEGRTCTCKQLDYCHQNDADCQHKACDASQSEVKVCLSGTCGCLAVPDFCGGDDTSTCLHIKCNQYQVKKCENGMCKCQVNPSCNSKEGLNDSCTPENTYLELKGTDGKSYYANCTDSFHYPVCVGDRCQCVYWKTPPPNLTSEGSTIPTNSMTDVAGSIVSSTVTSHTTEAMTDSSTPIPTDQPTGVSQTNQTTASVPNTTEAPPTISVTTCASRLDCNQQNTHLTFSTFTMPCPVDHIDCVDNKCFCSLDKITTSRAAGTTTQTVSTLTASSTSVGSTASTTNTTPLSTSHPPLTTTTTTAQKVSTTTASSTSVGSTASTTNTRLTCPVCDQNQNCNVTQACSLGEVCMIRNTPFTVHCSKKQDCIFMQTLVKETACCEDHQCISTNVPEEFIHINKYF